MHLFKRSLFHKRVHPKVHAFRYNVFLGIDLDKLEEQSKELIFLGITHLICLVFIIKII